MTEIEKEPVRGAESHELWASRLRSALQFRRDHWNGDSAWRQSLRLYRGEHWTHEDVPFGERYSDDPSNSITVNIVQATVQDFLPFLVASEPVVDLRPRNLKSVTHASSFEVYINYLWRHLKFTRQIKRAVLDSVLVGHGVVRTNYAFDIDLAAVSRDTTLNYESIKAENPTVRRVSPFQFVIDQDATSLEDARWCAEINFVTLGDLLERKLYKQSVLRKIRTEEYSPTLADDFVKSSTQYEYFIKDLTKDEIRDMDTVVTWELWDKRTRTRRVYVDGVPEPVLESRWPEYLQEFPYLRLEYIHVPDDLYPIGLVRSLVDQQLELNRVRTKDFLRHRALGTILTYPQDLVSPTDLQKILNGDEFSLVPYKGAASSEPIISQVSLRTQTFDSASMTQRIYDDMRRTSGSDALLSGGDLKSRTSATEVTQRVNFFGSKVRGKVDSVREFIRDVARLVVLHVRGNMRTTQVIPVLGESLGTAVGKEFLEINPDMVQGEYDLEVSAVHASEESPAQVRQQRTIIFQLMLQNAELLAQSGTPLDIPQLFEWLLESFDQPNVSKFFLAPTSSGVELTPGLEVSADPSSQDETDQVRSAAVNPGSSIAGSLVGRGSSGLPGG